MTYRKVKLNHWFKDSFHCVVENLEFDEIEYDLSALMIPSEKVKSNETNTI